MGKFYISEMLEQLPEDRRSIFMAEYEAQKRGVGITFLLNLFLGALGIHRFYLRDTGWGICYLILAIFTLCVGSSLLALIDLVCVASNVDHANKNIAKAIFRHFQPVPQKLNTANPV